MIYLDSSEFPSTQSCYCSLTNKDWYWIDETDYELHPNFLLKDKFLAGPTILVEWEE